MVLCGAFNPFFCEVEMNKLLFLCFLMAAAPFANAQSSSSSAGVSTPTNTTSLALPKQSRGTPLRVNLIGGIYSFSDFGRKVEETNPKNGRLVSIKNEIFAGFRTDDGWGLQAMVVPYFKSYDAKESLGKNTKVIPGDPSLSFMHPIYKSDTILISGKYREYFPASDYSIDRHNWLQTYYLNLAWKLPHRFDLFNQLIPRYFIQSYYKHDDNSFFTEDYTAVTRSLNSWTRVGVGQHTQIAVHPSDDPVGKTVELYPMADIMITPTIFFGPRVYFPIYTQNTVFDGPTATNFDNVQTELFFQATL
jgi:hypothetical protein